MHAHTTTISPSPPSHPHTGYSSGYWSGHPGVPEADVGSLQRCSGTERNHCGGTPPREHILCEQLQPEMFITPQSSPFSFPSPSFSSPFLSLPPPFPSSQPLKPVSRVRLAAVQYGSTVFPFDHIPSRFVCVIGAGDRYDSCDCSFTTHWTINPVFLAVRMT